MNKIIVLLAFLLATLTVSAQDYVITGKLIDSKTGRPVELAGVRLMKGDSTFVRGENTDSTGVFTLKVNDAGKYILKFSFVGYDSQTRNISLSSQKKTTDLGNIVLKTNDVLLKQATVSTYASKMEIKGDTFVYNAAAYRVPEGSTLEALVEKLPGAEVGDDGSIKINGKSVSQIRVDGKDFFKGDTKIAMKNMPVELIDK